MESAATGEAMKDEPKTEWASQQTLDEIAALAAARKHNLSRMQTGERPLTLASARKILDYLERRPLREGVPLTAPPEPPRRTRVARDGLFSLDGVVYKVQRAVVTGSGHLYAKRLKVKEDADGVKHGKWVMAPGMLAKLAEEDRLDPDKAAEFGKLYGVCLDCGSPLTLETSIAQGRGDMCQGKIGERSWY
jgi:hypothetical protein